MRKRTVAKIQKKCLHRFRKPLLYPFELWGQAVAFQWPHVYSRQRRSGQARYVVDIGLINGKRERPSFMTKAEAGTFAELKRTERQNQGTAALALPQAIKPIFDSLKRCTPGFQ